MPKRTSRNAQGAGSIRQRPDGRWEARYTMGRDPGTGKQIQRSVYGDTQGEVLKKLKLIQAEAEQGNYVEPSKMTVGEWLDIWAAEYLGGTKDATEYAYKAKIRNHIKPALGAVKLQKLNPHNVQSFYNDLRHTYAVNALQSGDDIKTVQDNLGHHTAAFTLDTYGHVTEKMKQDSADRMEQYIQSITKKSRPGLICYPHKRQ